MNELPPIMAGDRYRRKGAPTDVVVTRSTEDAHGIRRIWYRRGDGRTFFNLPNESWDYEQNFRIDFERVDDGHGPIDANTDEGQPQ